MDPFDPKLKLADCESALHELARAMTGLENFGSHDYRRGLLRLLQSCDDDADLSPAGRRAVAGIIITALAGRLTSEAAWAANPGYRAVAIDRPIVIVGLPRTGTTALHRMLCAIDEHQGLELWLANWPQPRPLRSSWSDQPAFQRAAEIVASANRAAPELAAIHEMRPEAPDECWNLLRQDFCSVTFECVFRVEGYSRWWEGTDMSAAYGRWADNLRLIGMNDRGRRWILKDPSHLFAPEALLTAVPDATIVMTHRDPAKAIPSVCSLNSAARASHDRVPDPVRLGREQLELWARGIERFTAARARAPERFVDVHFDDLLADPSATLRRVVAAAGGRMDAAGDAAAAAWRAANAAIPHRYDSTAFGLTEAGIRARYSDYIAEYQVRIEA